MNTTQTIARSPWLRCLTLAAHGLALTFLVAGCTGVYVSHPIGERPHVLVADEWNGSWTAGEGAVVARVADSAGGKLQYSETNVRDGAFVTKTTELVVRESGGWLFATVMDDDNPERHEWARIRLHDGKIYLWVPDKDAFRALVKSGKLKGQLVDDDKIVLAPPSAEEMKALTTGALGVPFKWDEPFILHRLAP